MILLPIHCPSEDCPSGRLPPRKITPKKISCLKIALRKSDPYKFHMESLALGKLTRGRLFRDDCSLKTRWLFQIHPSLKPSHNLEKFEIPQRNYSHYFF